MDKYICMVGKDLNLEHVIHAIKLKCAVDVIVKPSAIEDGGWKLFLPAEAGFSAHRERSLVTFLQGLLMGLRFKQGRQTGTETVEIVKHVNLPVQFSVMTANGRVYASSIETTDWTLVGYYHDGYDEWQRTGKYVMIDLRLDDAQKGR